MKKYILFFILLMQTTIGVVDVTVSCINQPVRSVDVTQSCHIGGGFFCEFGSVINNIIYYEQDGIKAMRVDWSDQFFPYKDEPHSNGWDLYFEPIHIDTSAINTNEPVHHVGNALVHELHDQLCVAHWLRYDEYLPYRLFVHEIINKYITIKQHILNQVQEFYEHNMKGHMCIGLHIRYADAHGQETPAGHPSLADYAREVDELLKQHRHARIFMASDSYAAINYFKKKYGKKLLYINTYRAYEKEDPGLMYENSGYWMSHPTEWHQAKPGYEGGRGALLDCLLLARCHYFIHITSNVATYVCFFNPRIKSIYLPRAVPFAHCRFRGDPSIRNKFLNPI